MREALKPVLPLWIDTAIKAVLDLPVWSINSIHRERLWFFIDELPTLQKMDILKLALKNTHKHGLCCVIGIQDKADRKYPDGVRNIRRVHTRNAGSIACCFFACGQP